MKIFSKRSMRNILFCAFIFFSVAASAQVQLGLKLAPVIVSNRAANDSLTAKNDGSVVKMSIGLIADKSFADNYMISSGLIYIPKRSAFRDSRLGVTEEYKVQYLQIPLTVKLFTNELAPDLKVYFQVGGALEIKVFDEPLDPSYTLIEKFNPVDVPVILAAGIEYRAGLSTTIFAAFSYQRGLTNVIKTGAASIDDLAIRSTVISIDLGVKF
ncbi:MAG: porin family protein [Cyclobacteriaceae bacterium]